STSDSILVRVDFTMDSSSFYIPNAFTPNNDGKNDCFSVRYWGYTQSFEMNIYNRWGERVFHTNNIQACWNGFYKGELQPSETFIYIIKMEGPCGSTTRKGTITLI